MRIPIRVVGEEEAGEAPEKRATEPQGKHAHHGPAERERPGAGAKMSGCRSGVPEAPAEQPLSTGREDGDRHGESPEELPAGPGNVDEVGGAKAELSCEERYLRLLADFENFKRRSQEERKELVQIGRETVLTDLIPLLEHLERALDNSGSTGGQEAIRRGIDLIRQELLAVMEKNGLERIPTAGQTFDPRVHEAVAVVPGRGTETGLVIEEVRPGFRRNGKVLRPASVIVSG
ncbi:MAG: nucleotide exchange factor GrpE [bacterium]